LQDVKRRRLGPLARLKEGDDGLAQDRTAEKNILT